MSGFLGRSTTVTRRAFSVERLASFPSFKTRFVPYRNDLNVRKSHSLHTGVLATPKDQDTSPDVILIFGWTGAQPKHLEKYTYTYTKLYPQASQIVVQCTPDLFWTTAGTRARVTDTLEALHCLPCSSPQKRPRILTHVFSNGGSLQMILLGRMLQRTYGSASVEGSLTSAIIFDSCPSVDNLKTFKLAFNAIFRKPIGRFLASSFMYVMHVIRSVGLSAVVGDGMVIMENLHVELWKPRILPWMGTHTPRLYLFSRPDKLIPWQDVAHHAETAKERGMDVRCELFEKSEHVQHTRGEPERYWSSVQEIWGVAISKEKGGDEQIHGSL